jgi:hypothetical protein
MRRFFVRGIYTQINGQLLISLINRYDFIGLFDLIKHIERA